MRPGAMVKTATLALLAGILVVLAPATRSELVAPYSKRASVLIDSISHADVALAPPLGARSSARDLLPAAQGENLVVVMFATFWFATIACLVVAAVGLLFTARRRRAPPLSLA